MSQGPAGERASFTVQRDAVLKVSAPGGAMAADQHDTATDIELIIRRASPIRLKAGDVPLPEPMADILQDIRVPAATARAYMVKAGDYIQVIDVAGRQCTDFQCFSARKLDKGLENALDATITRTLTGRSYPAPGLPSKMFGRDFEALVEIVQDTVGRHDAFATACRLYDCDA